METFFELLDLCEGNPPATSEFFLTKASDAALWCFLWSMPEQTVEQTTEAGDLDATMLIMASL